MHYIVLLGCTIVLLGCTIVLLGCTIVLLGCTIVLLGCTVVLLGCTIVLLGCTIVYWVHYSFTGVHCIAPLTFLPGAKHMESLHLLGCMVTNIAIHTQPHSNVSGILIAEREARQLIVQCGGRI